MKWLWHRLPRQRRYRTAIFWYDLVSRLDRRGEILFLNHGYAASDPAEAAPALDARDEPNRYPVQLYREVAGAIDWRGLDGLEVGCGRGGGTEYVARAFRPNRLVGLDIARQAIAFCRDRHQAEGLSFVCGDAQRLPFPDARFDVVLNVESSGSYPDRAAFFAEVVRVLRPGGHFLFADYRKKASAAKLRRQLARLPMILVGERDISANVRAALALDDARKRRLIREVVPWPLRGLAGRFAFVRGGADDEYGALGRGDRIYLSCVFVKPGEAGPSPGHPSQAGAPARHPATRGVVSVPPG